MMNIAKKLCVLMLVMSLTIVAGCSKGTDTKEVNGGTADSYIEKAQKYIDEKDYDAAIDILQLGIETVDDEDLEAMLEEVIQLQLESLNDHENDSSKEENNIENATTNPPDENQITSDIASYGANCFLLNGNAEYLDVKSLELQRRKTQDGYDEVYVTAHLENEFYAVDAEYVLCYSYYDVGGWYLDNCYFTTYTSAAKKSIATEQDVLNFFSPYFSSIRITSHEDGTNHNGIYTDCYTFEAVIEHSYVSDYFTGTCYLEFSNDVWHESKSVSYTKSDWSRLLGTWEYQQSGESIYLYIENISMSDDGMANEFNPGTVTWGYDTSPWEYYQSNVVRNNPLTAKSQEIKSCETTCFTDEISIGECNFSVYESIWLNITLGDGYAPATISVRLHRDEGVYIPNFELAYPNHTYGTEKGTIYFTNVSN